MDAGTNIKLYDLVDQVFDGNWSNVKKSGEELDKLKRWVYQLQEMSKAMADAAVSDARKDEPNVSSS